MRGSGPQSTACFLGPTRGHIPDGIWIGSAVFARLTIVTDREADRPCYSLCDSIGRIDVVLRCSLIIPNCGLRCSREWGGVDRETVRTWILPAARRVDGFHVRAGADRPGEGEQRRQRRVHDTMVRPQQQRRNHRQNGKVGSSSSVFSYSDCCFLGLSTVSLPCQRCVCFL